VIIPRATARNWVESEQVSLMSEQPIDSESRNGVVKNETPKNVLKILIEKDFVCLDRKEDPDNADAFPHPTGKCG
jgi:hypothetical protein